MPEPVVACPSCKTPWPAAPMELAALRACPGCLREMQIEIFPAYGRLVLAGSAGEPVVVEGEAACFYHADRRAVVHCDACGRFLCALCDLDLHGQHLCPACLETGRRKGTMAALERERVLYDSTALGVAALPLLLCWPITLVTAPLAILVAIYGWKKPGSLIARRRLRFHLALLLAALQIAGWILGFLGAFRGL